MKTVFEISAGGVVYKKDETGYWFLLISVKDGKVWTLPKGLVEKGEKPENAALREIKEETGVSGRIETFLDKVELWFFQKENGETVRHHKIIYHYLVEYMEGDITQHDFEVNEVKWFRPEEALKNASYEKDKKIIEKAIEYLRSKDA
jgi:8-oxo-dGTP diphosphatase